MARTLDQMLATEKPEVVAKAQKAATEMLLNIHLAELRDRMNLTRGNCCISGCETADSLEMEKRTDLKLSSIKRYVEASVASYASMLNFGRHPLRLCRLTRYAPLWGVLLSCTSSSRLRYISPARSLPSSVSLKASFREAFRYLFNRPFSTSVA